MQAMMKQFILSGLLIAILAIPPTLYWRRHRRGKTFLLLYLVVLVWINRFAVGQYLAQPEQFSTGGKLLVLVEVFFDSFIHMLQCFGLDDDYAGYVAHGMEMLTALGVSSEAVAVYGIVTSVLNAVTPIIGGAFVLDLLTGFFPSVRLALMPLRRKFVFSQLNENALILAEDILRDQQYRTVMNIRGFCLRPVMIFCDVEKPEDSTHAQALMERVKQMGGLCVPYGLSKPTLRWSRAVHYFLIHEDPRENLGALTELLETKPDGKPLWRCASVHAEPVCRAVVFGQDDVGCELVKRICDAHKPDSERILIRAIRNQTNTANNLMYEIPLFLPLLEKPEERRADLHVAIVGSTGLAEEIFKAVYWCGQIPNVRLHVRVLTEDPERWQSRLREQCPELLESCDPNAPLLRVKPYGPADLRNPPYLASLEFCQAEDLTAVAQYPSELVRLTDYYVLAMDADGDNLLAAQRLQHVLTARVMTEGLSLRPAIVPVVRDRRLAAAARQQKPGRYEPYVLPFASRESNFCCSNVYMSSIAKQSMANRELYNRKHSQKDLNDGYTNQCNEARALHAPYKLFGIGWLQEADLGKSLSERYRVQAPSDFSEEQEHLMAWVEHRRWNAFLRSRGFTCPTKEQLDRFYDTYGSKCIPLKLHPCLVESQPGAVVMPSRPDFDPEQYDYLDYVSMYLSKLGGKHTAAELQREEKKQYDYSVHDSALCELIGQHIEC